jgi:hypothetical protein
MEPTFDILPVRAGHRAIGEGLHFRKTERRLLTKDVFRQKSDGLERVPEVDPGLDAEMAKMHSFAVTGPGIGAIGTDRNRVRDCPVGNL